MSLLCQLSDNMELGTVGYLQQSFWEVLALGLESVDLSHFISLRWMIVWSPGVCQIDNIGNNNADFLDL